MYAVKTTKYTVDINKYHCIHANCIYILFRFTNFIPFCITGYAWFYRISAMFLGFLFVCIIILMYTGATDTCLLTATWLDLNEQIISQLTWFEKLSLNNTNMNNLYLQNLFPTTYNCSINEMCHFDVISIFLTLNTYYIVILIRLCCMYLKFKTYWWLIIRWNPAPALAGFSLQIQQNPAPAGFPKSKSATALVSIITLR